MKLSLIKQLLVALACGLALGGCTELSPISFKQVTLQQLQAEWTAYQQKQATYQQKLKDCIAATDRKATAATNSVNAGLWGQLLLELNDPQNTGSGATILTALLAALGGGAHLNNLRLNRKIANPEVPMNGDDAENANNGPGNNAGGGKTAKTDAINLVGASRADLAFQGGVATAVANSQNN